MAAAVHDTELGKIENRLLDLSKHNTTPEFNKITVSIFDRRSKQMCLAANSNDLLQCVDKNKEKIIKLQRFNLFLFLL